MASSSPSTAGRQAATVDDRSPRRMTWAFDLDGCLVDSLTATSLRPLAQEILERLSAAEHTVVLWSAGGDEHARRVAASHGVSDLVDAFYDKGGRDGWGRWLVEHLDAGHRPDVCVDDRPEETPSGVSVIGVSPYIAPDGHDTGLRPVLEAVRRAVDPRHAA